MEVVRIILACDSVVCAARLPCALIQVMMKVSSHIMLLPCVHMMIKEVRFRLIHHTAAHLLRLVEVCFRHIATHLLLLLRVVVVNERLGADEDINHVYSTLVCILLCISLISSNSVAVAVARQEKGIIKHLFLSIGSRIGF